MRIINPATRPPENLAEEYHVGSRASGALKRMFTAHELHYRPDTRALVTAAPLRVGGRPRVALPPPRTADRLTLEEAIVQRHSGRAFSQSSLLPEALAAVLVLGNGVRAWTALDDGERFYQRNVPNAGNLGSVEVYPIVLNVAGLEPGIYHFDSIAHDLAQLRAGQFGPWLREVVLFQLELAAAPVALALTSALGRLQSKYGLRGYRLGLLDVGHVAQNIYLTATALGLEVCETAGFVDAELDLALGLDGVETSTMLVMLLGDAPTLQSSGGTATVRSRSSDGNGFARAARMRTGLPGRT